MVFFAKDIVVCRSPCERGWDDGGPSLFEGAWACDCLMELKPGNRSREACFSFRPAGCPVVASCSSLPASRQQFPGLQLSSPLLSSLPRPARVFISNLTGWVWELATQEEHLGEERVPLAAGCMNLSPQVKQAPQIPLEAPGSHTASPEDVRTTGRSCRFLVLALWLTLDGGLH